MQSKPEYVVSSLEASFMWIPNPYPPCSLFLVQFSPPGFRIQGYWKRRGRNRVDWERKWKSQLTGQPLFIECLLCARHSQDPGDKAVNKRANLCPPVVDLWSS